ncbi:MAG: hypothetical protein KDD62_06580, partial [Bdellovibrionales bacterium]|nr:hypothetical protein [Bdellovibrionales bacterium]
VFQFVRTHQSKLLWLLVLVVGGFFLNKWYQQNQLEMRQSHAAVYAELRAALDEWRSENEELKKLPADASAEDKQEAQSEVESLARKVNGKIEALKNGPFPYSQVAVGYEARFYAESEEYEKLHSLLPQIDEVRTSGDPHFADLATLLAAKALYNSDAYRAQAWSMLVELAKDGSFVSTAAVISLSRMADSKEKKEEVLQLVLDLEGKQPEQGALLEPLKVRLESAA